MSYWLSTTLSYIPIDHRGTCPDTFTIVANPMQGGAAQQQTMCRKPGEPDDAFWNRTEAAMRDMASGLGQRVLVYLYFRYKTLDPAYAARMDDLRNMTTALMRMMHRDPHAENRVWAADALRSMWDL